MGNENGNFISPEKLEQTRRSASYKKDCCKKSTRINIRVTQHQNEEIARLAAESGLTKSRYILNRAFERPHLSVQAGTFITNFDENMNKVREQKDAFVNHCRNYGKVDVGVFNKLIFGLAELDSSFEQLKEELYKSYLTDIERANYEQRKKRREQREKEKQAKNGR